MKVSEKVKITPNPLVEECGIILAKMKVLEDISCEEIEELEEYIKSKLLGDVELVKGEPDYDYDLYITTIKFENSNYIFDLLIYNGNRICDEGEPYFKKGEELEIYLSPRTW